MKLLNLHGKINWWFKVYNKKFTHERNFDKIESFYFSKEHTFFWSNGNQYLPFQFKLGEKYFNLLKTKRTITDNQFNNFLFPEILENLLNVTGEKKIYW